jgi:2-methylcitrate dehydratase PrpD
MVQAIQDFQRKHPLQPQHITRVIIRGAPHIMAKRHTVRAPESVMGGQYSLLYSI